MAAPTIVTAGYLREQVERLDSAIALLSKAIDENIATKPEFGGFNMPSWVLYRARWIGFKNSIGIFTSLPIIANDTYAALKSYEAELEGFRKEAEKAGVPRAELPPEPNLPGEPRDVADKVVTGGLVLAGALGLAWILANRK